MTRKLTTALCAAAIAFLSISVRAAETNVVEAFGCKFNEGKTMADLDAVVKYYVAERSKVSSPALQKMVSRVWTPSLGNAPVDLVWFNSNLTYTEWGQVSDVLASSEVGRAIQARFNEVLTCPGSSLWAQDVLFSTLEAKPFKDDGTVIVNSFRCRLQPGKTIADTDAAVAAWKPVFEKAVAATGATAIAARRIPIVSGTGFDLAYIVAWDDNATYAATEEAYRADPGSAKADTLFAAAHTCESALFNSRTVVAEPN